MTRFYEVVTPIYHQDGRFVNPAKESGNNTFDNFRVEMRHKAIFPAHSILDAMVIAKALGHPAPILQPYQPPLQAI